MKYQITYNPTGETEKFRKNDWQSFESEVWSISRYVTCGMSESDVEILVDGKVVDLQTAIQAASFARKEWELKRSETKKQIRVFRGAANLPSNWHFVWVNK
jgi:hypothetical protein